MSETPGAEGGDASNAGTSAGSSDAANYQPYDRLETGPGGEACVGTGYVEAAPGTPAFDPATGLDFGNVLGTYAPCPPAPGGAAPVVTPAMVAARFWEEVPLPEPGPYIAPGRAITGKWAYLETRGQLGHVYTQDTPLGPLEIVATGSYVVDWGDGETTGPYRFEGRPWPDGEIRHTYVWVGAYDVVVTENWTATWTLGGAGGSLRQLRTEGRIEGFPVQEIQAVRLR